MTTEKNKWHDIADDVRKRQEAQRTLLCVQLDAREAGQWVAPSDITRTLEAYHRLDELARKCQLLGDITSRTIAPHVVRDAPRLRRGDIIRTDEGLLIVDGAESGIFQGHAPWEHRTVIHGDIVKPMLGGMERRAIITSVRNTDRINAWRTDND